MFNTLKKRTETEITHDKRNAHDNKTLQMPLASFQLKTLNKVKTMQFYKYWSSHWNLTVIKELVINDDKKG
jgi:hypothetical protein